MKLKNVLCMAALAAAVAFTGVPVSGTAQVVHAEESQIAGLDEILKQMYVLYASGNYASMYALDTSEATKAYVESVISSGSDRYVIDLDGNTKAMLYIAPSGGYWWYFGQMENNLRQGTGATIICDSDSTEIFTGTYSADFPSGEGKLALNWNDGDNLSVSGNFQGTHLNGTYQVNMNWLDSYEMLPHSSSLPITYVNDHLQAVGGWSLEVYTYEGEFTDYYFWNENEDAIIEIDGSYELAAIGFSDGYYFYWRRSIENIAEGLSIFKGNAAAYTPSTTPAPEVTAPVPAEPTTPAPEAIVPVPETPVVPQTTVTPGTYTVQRGDNLSKIAQKIYGDQKLWRKIYEANSGVIKSDYIIWANQVLVIPAL